MTTCKQSNQISKVEIKKKTKNQVKYFQNKFIENNTNGYYIFLLVVLNLYFHELL